MGWYADAPEIPSTNSICQLVFERGPLYYLVPNYPQEHYSHAILHIVIYLINAAQDITKSTIQDAFYASRFLGGVTTYNL